MVPHCCRCTETTTFLQGIIDKTAAYGGGWAQIPCGFHATLALTLPSGVKIGSAHCHADPTRMARASASDDAPYIDPETILDALDEKARRLPFVPGAVIHQSWPIWRAGANNRVTQSRVSQPLFIVSAALPVRAWLRPMNHRNHTARSD